MLETDKAVLHKIVNSKYHYYRLLAWTGLILAWLIGVSASSIWYSFTLEKMHPPATDYIFTVESGASIGQVASKLAQDKIISDRRLFHWVALLHEKMSGKWNGQTTKIQAGEYLITADMTQADLLHAMVTGDVVHYNFTLVEGWSLQQLMLALRDAHKITVTKADLDFLSSNGAAVVQSKSSVTSSLPQAQNHGGMDQVDLQVNHGFFTAADAVGEGLAIELANTNNIEGLFWPATYDYTAGTDATTLLRRANKLMQTKLQQMWRERAANCKLNNMYEAVILASIIEKETRVPTEYIEVSGVYHRRLQKKMRLQADPTVIYAYTLLGEFKSPLSRAHLNIDSPFNTYKNAGLPPTPIAAPGEGALYAAMHPAEGTALYFVADSNGGHVFSATLTEHINAINKVKRQQKAVNVN